MTNREIEVEALLYSKLPMKQIGAKLGIATRTVKAHCCKVYDFRGVQDRIELMSMKIESLKDDIDLQYELQLEDW